jgi:hypothetical protein
MTIEEFLAEPQRLADVELEVHRLAHCALRALVKRDGYVLTQDEFILLARCYACGLRTWLLPEAIANLRFAGQS